MRKKITTQQITYAEIFIYAIHHISDRIQQLYDGCKDDPVGSPTNIIVKEMVETLKEKRALMKILYLMETGTEYAE